MLVRLRELGIRSLMVEGGFGVALEWARRARQVARQSGAPSVEADTLVTIGQLSNRAGNTDEAIGMFTAAYQQAAAARVLGVELRAAYNLAAEQLARGELAAAATTFAGMLWPMANPPGVLRELYEQQPELARACPPFAPTLGRLVHGLAEGLPALRR